MSLRSRYRVKAYMILMRADHLFTHNYIRSLLNIILRPILMRRTVLELATYCLCVCRRPHDALPTELSGIIFNFIILYILVYKIVRYCINQASLLEIV